MSLIAAGTCPMRQISGLRLHSRTPLAPPPLRPPLLRRQRPARCPSADAASVPAPDSSSGSNGAGAASGSNGAGPAGEVQQAGQQQRAGFFGWLQGQRERSAELRQKLGSLGLAAVLAYGEGCVLHKLVPLRGMAARVRALQCCCRRLCRLAMPN